MSGLMDAREQVIDTTGGGRLAVTRWRAEGPTVVLLHAGVTDQRSWTAVAVALAHEQVDVVAYDRRGFGASPAAETTSAFTHVADLMEVLDHLALDQVVLVGNSMGGVLALDAALLHPDRVTGVVLIGAAVSGMTDDDTPFDWRPDTATAHLIDKADDASLSTGDRLRALAHLWLDGPASTEGRVGGEARTLFSEMNRDIVDVDETGPTGDAGVDAWTRLPELTVPVLSTWGELDLPCDIPFYEETARRIGQRPGRVLPKVAHLPGLEQPQLVAHLIGDELGRLQQ
jgi:pimeloyl-ACP methyl ester carboxylesterase